MSIDSNAAEKRSGIFDWFLHSEVSGSVILLFCTLIALVWANSPWASSYEHLLHTKVGVSFGENAFALSLHHWINDGLMVIFFFVVGLEIKRELVVGQLSSFKKAIVPCMAALGGMLVPAAIYATVNFGGEGARGWGVPMATDIAFSLGVLSMLGKRVPLALKVFLTAAAIADDLGAVVVIALFYTAEIQFNWLLLAAALLAALYVALHVFNIRRMGILLTLILGVWVAVFISGIHATVAGVLVAMLVPVKPVAEPRRLLGVVEEGTRRLRGSDLTSTSIVLDHHELEAVVDVERAARQMQPPGLRLEHYWHPVQAFFILPLFALANAGVRLDQRLLDSATNPVGLGIILGLFVGKPVGFLLFSWLAVRFGNADLPAGTNWRQLAAMSFLAGIGFTMSLFVTELAFTSEALISDAKVGILIASLISAIAGYFALHRVLPRLDSHSPSVISDAR
jgi:NhaA family Na+:H+ antiporter